MQEFKHLRRQNLCAERGSTEPSPSTHYFETYDAERSPFDARLDSTVDEDLLGAELVRTQRAGDTAPLSGRAAATR